MFCHNYISLNNNYDPLISDKFQKGKHSVLFILHVATAVLVLTLDSNAEKFQIVKIDSNSNVQFITKINLLIFICVIESITALAHFIYFFKQDISRMFEYSLSSSLMIFVVASLCGITDIIQLVCISCFQLITIIFGFLQEVDQNESKIYFWLGMCPYSIAFGIIIYYLIISDPPTFVYGIFTGIIVFFSLFAINMGSWIYKKPEYFCGKENNYSSYLEISDLLSVVSKLFLAWYLYAGITNMD